MPCCDFANLMPINSAIKAMLEQTPSTEQTEWVSLKEALHRITAENILSPMNVPPFANSAMDGYAVRLADVEKNLCLELAGKSMAGSPFNGEWPENTCIRIMTGAAIPKGTDAVVMQEKVEVKDTRIHFSSIPKLNENIRPIGDDVEKGEIVLSKGVKITVREMPLLASLGIKKVKVQKKVKVAFFSTGYELRQLGETLEEGQIYDSNRYTIASWLEQMHCEGLDLGVIPDNKAALKEAFLMASTQADLIITSGGVSVGEADFTKEVLEEEGQIHFWKIAIKPGKPFAFGKMQDTLFCGLPGNPVSALITLHVLVKPLLAKLAGFSWQQKQTLPAIAQTSFKKSLGRTDYQRAFYSVNGKGQIIVSSINNQSSGAFSSMTKANCFAILEQERGNVAMNEIVMIEPFDETLN